MNIYLPLLLVKSNFNVGENREQDWDPRAVNYEPVGFELERLVGFYLANKWLDFIDSQLK